MNRDRKNIAKETQQAPEVDACVKEVFRIARYIQSDAKTKSMISYVAELLKWNKKINLTGSRDVMSLAEKQLFDSCMPIKWQIDKFSEKATLLDLGSGGGFPAIPLKIMRPQLNMHLIESRMKKVNFLKHIARTLKLTEFEVHCSRFPFIESETLIGKDIDIITSKAVKPDLGILSAMYQLLSDDGIVLLYRKFVKEEKKIIEKGKFKISEELSYLLPKSRARRTITILQKNST